MRKFLTFVFALNVFVLGLNVGAGNIGIHMLVSALAIVLLGAVVIFGED